MRNFLLKNKRHIIIIICCLLLLVPVLIVGSYDRPVADDYDYSIITKEVVQNGGNLLDLIGAAIQTDWNFYNNWQGLYSSAFILSLQPAIFSANFYSLTCIIVMVIAFLSLFFSMNILNKYFIKQSKFYIFTYSLLILTILVLLLPSATEGLFWYNGAMNYMPWAFTNILGVCLLIELFYTDKKSKKFYLLIFFSTLLSFFTSGGNHVTAFANILIMLISTLFLIIKKRRFYSTFPLIFAIIGFIIMFFAPGTAVRQNAIHQFGFIAPSINETLISTFHQVKSISMSWINFKWILSLILITPLALEISENIKNKINLYVPIISLICSFLLLFGMFIIPYYAMGSFGAPRLINVVWVTFMILSWLNYTFIISALEKVNFVNFDLNNKYFKKWFVLIVIISLFLIFYMPQDDVCSNSYICLHELKTGIAEKYSVEMDDRINFIKSSNSDDIKLKPITPGSVLYFSDLNKDPTVWPNPVMANYFNKKSISIY